MFEFVAIVGSRAYPHPAEVIAYVKALPPNVIVVTGGAIGVDRLAEGTARKRGLGVLVFEAVWSRGQHAGFARNAHIAEGCQRMVAFWDGVSHGTQHAIAQAQNLGKPVDVRRPR